MNITNDAFEKIQANCKKGKHKLRENNFGVCWCVKCGLLSTSVGASSKLEEDKIIIKK